MRILRETIRRAIENSSRKLYLTDYYLTNIFHLGEEEWNRPFSTAGTLNIGSLVCEVPLLGKNRDGLDLIAAILEASNRGTTKTHIMLSANLSFKLLEKYLHTAIKLGFIQQIESNYRLTMKGRQFLREYKNLNQEYQAAQDKLMKLEHKRTLLECQCQEFLQKSKNTLHLCQTEKN